VSREWKPGDVARITLSNGFVHPVALWNLSNGWLTRDNVIHPAQVTDARPLVVIDPEDREQVERLLTSLQGMSFSAHACGAFTCLQGALRSLLAPPRPEEPTGLGAVVRYDGSEWVGLGVGYRGTRWLEIPQDDMAEPRRYNWQDFPSGVEVLRDGWSE